MENIQFFSILIIFILIFLLFLRKRKPKIDIANKIENFESYISVLNYHLQKAYDIIYKDRILIYSMEGMRIDDKDFDTIVKDFIFLVLKLIGPNLKNEFIQLYGNEETLMFNMAEFFNDKLENDQIRESTRNQIFQNEDVKIEE
jgi:hypothetical protein